MNNIICGNAVNELKKVNSRSINCCVTSPPYWGLRDYQHPDQLGREESIGQYVDNLIEVFDQVKRILKGSGTCWIVISDTYAGSGDKNGARDKKNRGRNGQDNALNSHVPGIKDKSLCMIPERFAIKMVQKGWLLRNKIIWRKPNGMPEPVHDRYTVNWEYVYLFTKSEHYYWNMQYNQYADSSILQMFTKYANQSQKNYQDQNVQDPSNVKRSIIKGQGATADYYLSKYIDQRTILNRTVSERKQSRIIAVQMFKDKKERQKFINWVHDHGSVLKLQRFGGNKKAGGIRTYSGKEWTPSPLGSIQRAVWDINTEACGFDHFAVFPKELVKRCIDAGCPELSCKKCQIPVFSDRPLCKCKADFQKGRVLDPFMGKGTVAQVALEMNRDFLGIELNPQYIDIANFIIRPLLPDTNK